MSSEKKPSSWSMVNEGRSGEMERVGGRGQTVWALQALITSLNYMWLQWEATGGV